MKKFLAICLTFVVACSCFAFVSTAETEASSSNEVTVSKTVEQLDGGFVLETVVTEETLGKTARANEYVRVGTKTNRLKNTSGEVLWTFTLRGQYDVVEGVSSVCTLASYSHSISDSSWSLDSASTSKSGNKAMASATFKKKILLVTTDTKSVNLTLTCDKNGNLS